MRIENRMERRARMLSDAIQQRILTTRNGLRPSNQPPPFTQSMSPEKALTWWEKNWNGPAGALALSGMDPISRLRLGAALSQRVAQRQSIDLGDTFTEGGNDYGIGG